MDIKITAEISATPEICRFVVGHPLLPSGQMSCKTKEVAQKSQLLSALFELPDVQEVLVNDNVLTIKQNGQSDWRQLGKQIGSIIREKISSGVPLFPAELTSPVAKEFTSQQHHQPALSGTDLENQVKKVLHDQVDPALAGHGGQVQLIKIENGKVYLQFGGGCHGCGMVSTTVKEGIEKILITNVSGITEVIDVTDHASGSNPYY